MTLHKQDLERALRFVQEAEKKMPRVFAGAEVTRHELGEMILDHVRSRGRVYMREIQQVFRPYGSGPLLTDIILKDLGEHGCQALKVKNSTTTLDPGSALILYSGSKSSHPSGETSEGSHPASAPEPVKL